MGHETISRSTAPSVLAFSADNSWSNANGIGAGVLVTSSGQVVGIRRLTDQHSPEGYRLDVFTPTGTSVLAQSKAATFGAFASALGFYDGVSVARIAAGGTKRIAVAGLYAYSLPWIQVLDLP